MKRKQFLRDIALGIAATILPRILQPAVPEVVSDGYDYSRFIMDEHAMWEDCNVQYVVGCDPYRRDGDYSCLVKVYRDTDKTEIIRST